MARRKEKLPAICERWREEAQRRRELNQDEKTRRVTAYGGWENGGICFQEPKGWTDGKPGLKYVPSGPFKGRLRWDSRREAQEVAKRISDVRGHEVRYDP